MFIAGSLIASFLIGGFGLAFFVGAIFLQIHLAKKENKWLGLILPIISLLLSLVVISGMAVFTTEKHSVGEISQDGTIIERTIEDDTKPISTTGALIFQVTYIFILCNIPTVILMLIYFTCRQKFKKRQEIDKMNIQDLE